MAAPTMPVEMVRTWPPFPKFNYNLVLAGVAKTVTVPAGVSWAFISVTDETWLNLGDSGTAAVPVVDEVDDTSGAGSVLIMPNDDAMARLFYVRGVAHFQLFGTARVSIAWYREHSDGVLA